MIGTRLGPCEITAKIGEGGMGEVYRATDSKLRREVAIKLLPEAFTGDPDRLARFEREAQLLAQLQHANIASIYGLEESGGTRGLIMELVEGPTLEEHMASRPLPLEEALSIARQIAEALEAAHERGIVHRDLKPQNVKLTPEGQVKVLDFGLAKALHTAATPTSVADLARSPTLLDSPTLTALPGTQLGVILGTAAYMSPEQARGSQVDRRADIWAFGVVLYEMLVGRALFAGETITDVLASVMRRDVPWAELPPLPVSVRRLLERCLDRDPRRRLRDIGEARVVLEGIAEGGDEEPEQSLPGRALGRSILPWVIAGALAVAGAWSVLRSAGPRPPAGLEGARFEIRLGSREPAVPEGQSIALSPDGSTLAFAGRVDGIVDLYVRELESLEPRKLEGTREASNPFFSPDGRWIGFFADGSLKKIPVGGGAVTPLTDEAPRNRGGAWAGDGSIYFTPRSFTGVGISRVSSNGGEVTVVTRPLDGGAVTDRWPQLLPGDEALLFTSHVNLGFYEDAHLVVQRLADGERKTVVSKGYFGRYSDSGHLVYVRDGMLLVAPFDIDRLEVTGQATSIVDSLSSNLELGVAQLAVGADRLAWVPGMTKSPGGPLVWLDRSGKTSLLRRENVTWRNPRFSADGKRLAMAIHDGRQADVWILDLEREVLSRVTYDGGDFPNWPPEGGRISFSDWSFRVSPDGSSDTTAGDELPKRGLYWRRADGTGPREPLLLAEDLGEVFEHSWHPGMRFLVVEVGEPETDTDLQLVELGDDVRETGGTGTFRPLVATKFKEKQPAFSPDGRWLAYVSNESGTDEIYVRPFPEGDGKWQVSTGGGVDPVWSRTKTEIVFLDPQDDRLMSAPYEISGSSFIPRKVAPWTEARILRRSIGLPFALHPDGERVVVRGVADGDDERHGTSIVLAFGAFRDLGPEAPR